MSKRNEIASVAGRQGLWALLAGFVACLVLGGCPDPQTSQKKLINAGNEHLWRAEYSQAIGPFKSALEHDASNAEVLYKIGQCYACMGDYREAIYWYNRAITSFPGYTAAITARHDAQRKLRPQPSPAEEPAPTAPTAPAVETAPSPEPVGPATRAHGLIEVAHAYEANRDTARAQASFQKAVDIAGNVAFTHAELGRFYMRHGMNDKAIEQLQEAAKLNPDEPGVADDLAKLGAQ